MIILSVRHRGLKRLIEDNQTKGLRPDLVNRVRNIDGLDCRRGYEDVPGRSATGLAGASTHGRPERHLEHFGLGKLADHV